MGWGCYCFLSRLSCLVSRSCLGDGSADAGVEVMLRESCPRCCTCHCFQVGEVLKDSYGGTFSDCSDRCLTFFPIPVGSRLSGDMNKRRIWFMANYPAVYYRYNCFLLNILACRPGAACIFHIMLSVTEQRCVY